MDTDVSDGKSGIEVIADNEFSVDLPRGDSRGGKLSDKQKRYALFLLQQISQGIASPSEQIKAIENLNRMRSYDEEGFLDTFAMAALQTPGFSDPELVTDSYLKWMAIQNKWHIDKSKKGKNMAQEAGMTIDVINKLRKMRPEDAKSLGDRRHTVIESDDKPIARKNSDDMDGVE